MMNILNAKHAYNLTKIVEECGLEDFEFLYTEFNTYTPTETKLSKYLYVNLDNFSEEKYGTIGELVDFLTAIVKKYFVDFYKVNMPKKEYHSSTNQLRFIL